MYRYYFTVKAFKFCAAIRILNLSSSNFIMQEKNLHTLRRLLPISRIYAAEIRLSFDSMHFAFSFFCIYIEKDNMCISAQKYA